MKIVWSAASVRHLRQVMEYIEGDSMMGATTVRRRILRTVQRVGEMPNSGREGRVDGTREAVVPGTAYIVVYRAGNNAVEVISIWHAAREWPPVF
jgi:toxin ParE1/3/4